MNFIHKLSLAPSKWLSRWIKVDKWDYFHSRVKRSAHCFVHSDPDPNSVFLLIFQNEMNHGSLIFFLGNAIEPIKELLRFISWFFCFLNSEFPLKFHGQVAIQWWFWQLNYAHSECDRYYQSSYKSNLFHKQTSMTYHRCLHSCSKRVLLNGILFEILFQL